MSAPLFLGIDVGTSGVRAALVDQSGDPVALERAPLPPSRRGSDGSARQHAEDWWTASVAAVTALPGGERRRVAALAVDATSATVVAVDADGRPMEMARMYDDHSARWAAERIAVTAPPRSAAHGASSALAKAMDLRRHHLQAEVITQADWLARRLGAPPGVSDENNVLKLGYDPVDRRWPQWMAGLLEDMPLPRALPPGTAMGRVSPQIATRLGLPSETIIAAGTTDSIAAALAAGIEAPGDGVTVLGSTLALKLVSRRPVFDPEHGVYSHRLGELWLAAGASNSGGAVLARFFTPEALTRLSKAIDPSRDSGLDYYPLNAPGERFPIADPDLPPRLSPRPEEDTHFLHGLLEGIARIEQQGYRLLSQLSATSLQRVLTSGGGAANTTWTALRQRLLGVSVQPARAVEAAVGAALLALAAFQHRPPLQTPAKE